MISAQEAADIVLQGNAVFLIFLGPDDDPNAHLHPNLQEAAATLQVIHARQLKST
jgi:predicted ATP-dependent endonuclease of OLD family